MTARSITCLARAKINLTLHVTGQRADGYHLLDSLVCFADIGDTITVSTSEQLSLAVEGPLADGVPTDDSNLVLKAAHLFRSKKGADINLTKRLPHAAGIGGGSADAAATLLALAELWDDPIPNEVVQLGADVPVCLAPKALRMQGVGDELSMMPDLPELYAVLVNPGVALETPPVFKALTQKRNSRMDSIPSWDTAVDFATWCGQQRNDLQAPALSLQPVIIDVLNALEPSLLARMSGSGATCFGLCADARQAENLATQIKANHPTWWIVATTLS